MGIFSNGRGVSGFAGILKAISDDTNFQNTLIKDKASIDNTRANTALNKQSFDFNDVNNPIMIKAKELANKMNQQTYDFNAQKNPMTLEGLGFDNASKSMANVDAQRRLDDRTAFMANPDIAQSLKDAWKMNYATGGKSFSPSKGDSAKPTILGTYNDAGFRTGNAVYNPANNTGIPINMQGQSGQQPTMDINKVLGDAMSQTYGTKEFNSTANQADFNVKANEVYQSFLQQTKNPQQAEELTKQYMFKTLGLDGDTEFGMFSDKELDYTPNNAPQQQQQQQQQPPTITTDEEYLALPAGTTYIADGQIRVKK